MNAFYSSRLKSCNIEERSSRNRGNYEKSFYSTVSFLRGCIKRETTAIVLLRWKKIYAQIYVSVLSSINEQNPREEPTLCATRKKKMNIHLMRRQKYNFHYLFVFVARVHLEIIVRGFTN